MIRREGDRMLIAGPATLQNITPLLEEGIVQVRSGAASADLAGVSELDSSLLAALLAWIREARRQDRELTVANLPKGLQTLAELYGVVELLPAADTRK